MATVILNEVCTMLAGRWINIIGRDAESYRDLARYLETATGSRIHLATEDGRSRPSLKFNAKSGLVLIDAMEDRPGTALDILVQCRKSGKKQLMYAFLNARHDTSLVRMTGPPEISGIFYEDDDYAHIVKGVLAMFNGDLWFPRKVMSRYLTNNTSSHRIMLRKHDLLTARELEILQLLATGAKNTDIAAELSLSVHTIKTHIYHIYKKLDVSNRTQAVDWATQNL